jgi:hypothetical protein
MRTVLGTATAACIAVLGFFPLIVCNPATCALRDEWLSGGVIVLGIGVLYALVIRRYPDFSPARVSRAFLAPVLRAPEARVVSLVAVLAFGAYLVVAIFVFQRRPILIDEIALVRQAQIFASGHFWLPAPAHPEFFSTLQMVTANGRVYSQYPAGGPAMLTPFVLAHATWLAGPVFGMLSVLAFAAFLRAAEPDGRIRLAALILFAFAPFVAFMSGTHMSCVPTLTLLLTAAAAIAHADRARAPRPWLSLFGGLALGVAATIRPADALAFAIPAGIWSLRRWPNALAVAAGAAVPIGLLMYVNAHTTGAPLLFGYEVFWGKGHDIGFHRSPIGQMHTPMTGMRFIATYLLQLNRYLFETPIPSLLPAIAALALVPRIDAPDRFLLAATGLLACVYVAYWHEGFFLGPRFFFALTPFFALWTARLPALVGPWPELVSRTVRGALVASAAIALAVGIPARASQWASSFATERWAQPDVARRAGVHDALVFVREGWEAQLVARLWALGVPPTVVEQTVRVVDACRLDSAVTALESRRVSHPEQALAPLLGDSARVRLIVAAPGESIPMQDGYTYPARCVDEVHLVARGVTPLAPVSILDDGNVYARDLGLRDSTLVAAYPGRPVFVLGPASSAADAMPTFSGRP